MEPDTSWLAFASCPKIKHSFLMLPTQSFINIALLPFLQLNEGLLIIVVYRPQPLLAKSD